MLKEDGTFKRTKESSVQGCVMYITAEERTTGNFAPQKAPPEKSHLMIEE
jgi:hypothetical protein